ncbi:hypothetical protein ASE01_02545 [Nocardioides sp. Root190]|uniref:DUF445 domain-containing protein n=1 Tax=Nocardioides sp. Root190 TaxID=1736488 RepID=UPI0006FA86E9|nr:DUF445 family protein [Nocardioides sp. Root190]KRB80550.1 hypothetical protein ASE01_02545 [Nocardioides sp. Root190]
MTPYVIAGVQTWAEIRADVSEYWYIYASMPVIAAIIGYATKIVAIEMLYRPMKFVGIGPFGWQGLVPRRAGKVAAVTIRLLTENLLRAEDLLARIDGADAVRELRVPLSHAVDEVAREVVDQVAPGGWDALPDPVRRLVRARVQQEAPGIVDRLLLEVRSDVDQFVDLHYLTVTTLVRNKHRLNDMMRQTAGSSMLFLRRTGLVFGFAIGLVQVVAWAVWHNVWIMPAFGFATGFLSDWIALTLLFRPQEPRRFLGKRMHGVLHASRDQITRDYARIMAADLFQPSALLEAVLTGGGADRLFAMVHREVDDVVARSLGPTKTLVAVGIGTERYEAAKATVVRRVLALLPEMPEVEDYAARVLDVENVLAEKMEQLTTEQFEGIMRPIFKDDEWLMISVGAFLGFLVGELQVELVTHLGGA